jgi:hypothetical protein
MSALGLTMKMSTLAGIAVAITAATSVYAQETIEFSPDKFALLSSPPEPMKPACEPWWHPTAERLLFPPSLEVAKPGRRFTVLYRRTTTACTCDYPN